MPTLAKKIAPILLGTMFVSLIFVAQAAEAAPRASKVTICHRTNSETNPYRRITVSANAADGVGGKSDHTGHDESYTDSGEIIHPVFDPDVSYPPNAKDWGDIIPPVRGGLGLNWEAGQDIYLGIGDSYGLCAARSAKQFYDDQVAAGVDPAVILADLDEQESLDDKELLGSPSAKFTDLDPAELTELLNSTPAAPSGARPPSSLVPVVGIQKVSGVVWYDDDRDGTYDSDEEPAPSVDVAIEGISAIASAGFSFGTSRTFATVLSDLGTDGTGGFTDSTVEAGQYDVTVTPPTGYEVTFDSEGTADGITQTDVPVNSFGFVWVGLAAIDGSGGTGGGTGDTAGSAGDTGGATSATADLASTGPAEFVPLAVLAASAIGFGLLTLLPRRPRPRGAHRS